MPLNLLLLIALEALILGGAIYAGVGARFLEAGDVPEDLQPLLPKALTFAGVMLALMTASGLYDLEWQGGVRTLLHRLGLSFGLGLVTMSLLFYFVPVLLVGRGAFLLSFGIALLGILLSRALFLRWARVGALKTRTLVIGTGSRAAHIEALLPASRCRAATPPARSSPAASPCAWRFRPPRPTCRNAARFRC